MDRSMKPEKKPDCTRQWPDQPFCAPAVRNMYDCCGHTWEDLWTEPCSDTCPYCGSEVQPSSSDVVEACACEYLED